MSRPRHVRLLPATILSAYALILLGIYTAAIGAGLACDARWPLCDGAVFGLFPANWPSFVEWFHRFIAMVTGFMILGSWWVVWKGEASPRSLRAMTVAVVLLPVQIWLGAQTVLTYDLVTLAGHFLLALIIFASLILATFWAFEPESTRGGGPSRLLAVALVLFIPFIVLTPQFLVIHSGRVQLVYYGLGVAIFGTLLIVAAMAGARRLALTSLACAGVLLVAVQLLAGRLVRSSLVATVDWAGAAATFAVLVVALWMSRRGEVGVAASESPSSAG